MALPKLPLEIFRHILRQFQLTRLIFIRDKLPRSDPLRLTLQSVIYEKISCGDKPCEGFWYSSAEGLLFLAASKVSVLNLKIIDSDDCCAGELEFLSFGCREFIPSIPKIEYEGRVEALRKYSDLTAFCKITNCRLDVSGNLDLVPPKVKEVTLSNSSSRLTHSIRSWPTTLTRIVIEDDVDVKHFELPKELKSLVTYKLCRLWNTFPQGLECLFILNSPCFSFDDSILPNLLRVLQLKECYMTDVSKLLWRLPRTLTFLNLSHNPIQSLFKFGIPTVS